MKIDGTTKPDTGWSKEFPQVEGFYFARRTQTNAPGLTVIQVWQYEDEWYAYRFANQDDIEAKDFICSLYEYLGPLSPSDFEQLIRLRKAAEAARKYLVGVSMTETGHNADRAREIADQIVLAQTSNRRTVVSNELDYRCDRLRDRVMQTREWKEEHSAHGTLERVVEEPQPLGYTIATLCCPCGARHYVIERKDFPQ